MSTPTTTRQWILQNKPLEFAVLDGEDPTFRLITADLPQLSENQVLVKTLYFSNDPAQRSWIKRDVIPERLYLPPVNIGSPMSAGGIAEVIESKTPEIPKGTLILAKVDWTEYSVLDAAKCTPIQPLPGLSITHFMGAFGLTGVTAYYGLREIAKVTKDDAVVVSGAAGATGSMAVQIAKKMLGSKYVSVLPSYEIEEPFFFYACDLLELKRETGSRNSRN